jgi:2-oxoisovalerate dehydrogenase E1 component
MRSIIPPAKTQSPVPVSIESLEASFGDDLPQTKKPQNMSRIIGFTLSEIMNENKNVVIAGEDVGKKGGVYAVTSRLQSRYGAHRVIDTLLDEQSILGLAIGLAHNDILPIPEIQFLAYVHNAEDQIRGEAATLSFFSNGQYTNPMVIRIAGLGYQKGFGGHFHNDNSIAVLRDIPGIVIACPSNGFDAMNMLRESVRLARDEQRVVVFLEPIALYMTRDLHEDKDGLWCNVYTPPEKDNAVAIGEVGVYGQGDELCIISYANGYYLSRQAAKILEEQYGVKLRVIDLRWLSPLPEQSLLAAIKPCKNILIVDECRHTGSLSESLFSLLSEKSGAGVKIKRLSALDSFIPLGRVATVTMPSRDDIIDESLAVLGLNQERKVRA